MNAKVITPRQALERLMNYCTRYETCSSKVLQKLRQWQIGKEEQQNILQYLVNKQFIDDIRYAKNFVRSKSKGSKWGMQKIRACLQQQGVDNNTISEALQEIDLDNEPTALEQLLRKKLQQLKAKSDADLQSKLIRFAVCKGYLYTTAINVVKQILNISISNIED